MLFTTPWFLAFSLIVFSGFSAMLWWPMGRRWLLLISSIVFYFRFSGLYSLLFVGVLATTVYLVALMASGPPVRVRCLIFTIALPVIALIYFRFTGFIASTLADIFGGLSEDKIAAAVAPAFVPLGISFFAFEFCHYLAEVMKGAKPIRNPLHFGIFAFFYPRMAAGPIIRFQNIIPQIETMPIPKREDVEIGIRRIAFGFIKKFFVADPVAILIAESYSSEAIIEGADVIYLCALLYVRIYMDFSAYSDMAIGLARLWGLRIPENFRFPFLATSPSAFWQRWHISLSTWIRDYIYIPLGGSSESRVRTALNLFFAMAICGLWHGSAWHFVLWGIVQGLFLIWGHFARRGIDVISLRLVTMVPRIESPLAIVRALGGWAATQTAVAFSWLLFFYPLADVLRILKSLPIYPIIPQLL